MTSRRLFTLLAAIIFLLVAAVNFYRLMFGFPISIGGYMIGNTISFFIMVASIALSMMLFREARTPAPH